MKYVSSKYIVGRVMRMLSMKQVSSHIEDIYEWIGEAVEMIGTTAPLVAKSTKNEGESGALTVRNHRVALPSDMVEYFFVEYMGRMLPLGADKSGFGLPNAERTTTVNRTISKYGYLTYLDGTPVSETDFAHYPQYSGEYHLINKNYIQTSFEEGHIKLHYLGMALDDCGLPLIPDEPKYKNAVTWYVTQMLLIQGYKHPVISWEVAYNMWENELPKAQNEMKTPNIAQMERFKTMWTRLIPRYNLADDFFMGAETPEIVDL